MKMSLSRILNGFLILSFLLVLLLFRNINYLLFHSMVELFCICISFTVFALSWNGRKYLKNNYLVFLGIAYLFVGVLDGFHFLSFEGMAIFTDYDYYAIQIWVGTRFLESSCVLVSILILRSKRSISPYPTVALFVLLSTIFLLSVYHVKIFPICFIPGIGQTPFKIYSEYAICLILFSAHVILRKNSSHFDPMIVNLLSISIILTILSELCFTLFVNHQDFSNFIGHILKALSFLMIYKAIINKGIREPFNIIFHEMKENERLMEKMNIHLREKTKLDGLTGIYNHAHLYKVLEIEIERSTRYGSELSIIMFDLDNFKSINDTFGHQAGDEILVRAAQIMGQNIRSVDILGRYGGEEFLIILPNTGKKESLQAAEKVRRDIESNLRIGDRIITLSGGLATFKREESREDLINTADKRLYQSKTKGKNICTGEE